MEDLIASISKTHLMLAEDIEFFESIRIRVSENQALTTRQAHAIRKVLSKYNDMSHLLYSDITHDQWRNCISDNHWRNPLRVLVEKRNEVRHLGDNLIGLTYNYKPELQQRIGKLNPSFRQDIRIISVTSSNIETIIDILGEYKFEMDNTLMEYLALCIASKRKKSHFVASDDGVVCNVCDSETISAFLLHIVGAERI